MLKSGSRVIGIDDAPFRRGVDRKTHIVGVMSRLSGYVEKVFVGEVTVDGDDSTERISDIVSSAGNVLAVLTDGVTFGGLNVCDIRKVAEATGVPVISFVDHMPDVERMAEAIQKHTVRPEGKIGILRALTTHRVEVDGHAAFLNIEGTDLDTAREIIRASTIRGHTPEPLRLAHLIAGALKNGVSRGRP
ncbi:hypothetical protein GCM10007108_06450 [Thermogymnomonas acidicola]|uniref:UPF0215 protein GCM10007108_06450 n=1 Tax=Thermogymnomonas acidicola TaxID=399579 RepID=A0AA37F949_9ARCH|nr:DUF99 family protein [Thermogymnomonas acidicola]GGM71107.1 hypothetical protein GCM10007108_06450 [Thermogymnomonas acidicola]